MRWSVMPLAKLPGALRIAEELPPGFQSGLDGPLVFQVDKIPPGRALTLGYKALAGGKPGQFEIHTKLDLPLAGAATDGSLKTFIDVEKEPNQ